MSTGYFHANYFHPNYWDANYWAPTGIPPVSGEVEQQNAAILPFATFNPTINIELNVGVTTPLLGFAAFDADANLDIDVTATTPALSLVPLNTGIGLEGYQLADIELNFTPTSDIVVTYGILPTTPSLGFTEMSHTIIEDFSINVGVSIASLGFTPFVTDASLNISVEPLPPSLGFSALNVTAGIGIQIPAAQPSLGFTTATHFIVGSDAAETNVFPDGVALTLTALDATVVASSDLGEQKGDTYVQSGRPADVAVGGRF